MPEREFADASHGAAKPESTQKSWLPPGETRSLIPRLPVELQREPRQLALDSDTTMKALERLLPERRA
ncbi:MAG: hypothetical protein OXE43_13170 [Chloroflexi bacterium]|nr:hypothetical protein [Chloroflexota bacterium]